jgi:pyruvate dehydrogenase E2 component (dihydrolipoyllysine-residue acetyltransferase)
MNVAELKQVLIPDIGDFKDVPVIEVLVKAGDTVKKEDSLVSLESDKATIDIPSPYAGLIKEINVNTGDKLSEGDQILVMEAAADEENEANEENDTKAAPESSDSDTSTGSEPAADVEEKSRESPDDAKSESRSPTKNIPVNQEDFSKAHASPSVRRFARELGVNLGLIAGSGPKQRILKEDVQAYVKAELSKTQGGKGAGAALNLLPWPQVNFAKFGPIELKPLSRIKQISGANLHRNWVMIPHVTQFDEADITDLEALRKETNDSVKKDNVKLTLLAFLMKALIPVLKKFPEFNASLDQKDSETNLIIKNYYHIGFAVDTPGGLMVPVIKDVDQKGVIDIARELNNLSVLAREGKLKPDDMQGASFTISSLGGIGGIGFTPIINAPEVAILGVSRASLKPVYRDNQFIPRLMLPFSLSYDHRVIDGASAARFTTHLADVLTDMRLALF